MADQAEHNDGDEYNDESKQDYEGEYSAAAAASSQQFASTPLGKYEYLDHTADVQVHSWGDSLKEAFEQCAVAMFGYMTTRLDRVEEREEGEVECSADDLDGLLFRFLNECLCVFTIEPYLICRSVEILEFRMPAAAEGGSASAGAEDKGEGELGDAYYIRAVCRGEPFDPPQRHPPGTEVKAITYSNMQIHNPNQTSGLYELFVVLDI